MPKVAGSDLKPGDQVAGLWFRGDEPSLVIATKPYTGKFTEHFTHTVRFQSNTPRGWLEMSVGSELYNVTGTWND